MKNINFIGIHEFIVNARLPTHYFENQYIRKRIKPFILPFLYGLYQMVDERKFLKIDIFYLKMQKD